MKKLFLASLFAVTFLAFYPFLVFANSCSGSWVNPITDVCWSCLFPISIGSAGVMSGTVPDTENPKSPLCACGSPIPRIGLSIGFWEPTVLVDVTRHPFCLVNLGGLTLSMGSSFNTGSVETAENDDTHSFYYVHWYVYPLLNWLNLIDDIACTKRMTACLSCGRHRIHHLIAIS